MIFMPPRHAKSETVTIRYLAWRLELDPKMNIILGSYNQKLANRFSRRIRRIVEERVPLAKDRKAVEGDTTLSEADRTAKLKVIDGKLSELAKLVK